MARVIPKRFIDQITSRRQIIELRAISFRDGEMIFFLSSFAIDFSVISDFSDSGDFPDPLGNSMTTKQHTVEISPFPSRDFRSETLLRYLPIRFTRDNPL